MKVKIGEIIEALIKRSIPQNLKKQSGYSEIHIKNNGKRGKFVFDQYGYLIGYFEKQGRQYVETAKWADYPSDINTSKSQ